MVVSTQKQSTNQFGSGSFMSEGLTLETIQADDTTLALVEGKDVADENLQNQGLVHYIKGRYSRSKLRRRTDEDRWLACYRDFRGIYGPEVQFTETEKSQAFIKIAKTKALAAYAQLVDIIFAGNRFPIGVEASKVPDGIEESVHFDSKEPADSSGGSPTGNSTVARQDILDGLGPLKESLARVQDKLKEGPGLTPSSLTWEPAKEAAKKLEKKIQDQLDEAGADESLRQMIYEMCIFGTGIYKGPFAKDKEYAKWSETGEYQPEIKQIADLEFVSLWDAYPDPDATSMSDSEFFIQRYRMSKTQLRALKKRPYFRTKSIENAIDDGYNYIEEYWENTLRDFESKSGTERFEVLEFWGVADSDFEEITELDIPAKYKKRDQVQINAWICNGHILRVVFNPFTPARIPYFAVPYELNPYSFFGIGIVENMMDTQLLMNGFMRMAVDNAVLAGNVVFEVNENNLVPGQDLKMYPGKVIRTQGQMGQSVWVNKFQSMTQDNLAMFDKARQLADEATGMPSYAHGQGGVQGVGRTASGMSMLMGAAKENIKAIVRNIDDYLLIPLGKALFAFNMQFDFDKDFIGDLEITAKGTESLMRNEVRSQKILQFMQMTNNPIDAPFVKRDYLLRELSESLDLEADKCVNDQREAGIQAEMMKAMMLAQGIDPNKQQPAGGANSAGAASPNDPTQTGGGNIQPGAAPGPQQAGFSGSGGGGAPPQQPQGQ